MKTRGALKWGFVFLLGGTIGAFATLAAMLGEEAPPVTAGALAPIPLPTDPKARLPEPVELEATGDEDLARALEQALFERRWERVGAVARALRQRAAERSPAQAAAPASDPSEPSLLALRDELARQSFRRELERRDNAATRAAAPDLPLDEREQRLVDLFLAPAPGELERAVRRDAALLLARLGTEGGRAALLQALREPDRERADLAEEALARADDPAVAAALTELVRKDPDPRLRLRAARALGAAPEVVRGGRAAVALAAIALDDQDAEVRQAALRGLGEVELEACPPARAALGRVVGDPAEPLELRRAALGAVRHYESVARRLPAELAEQLERALPSAPSPLREALVETLGEAGRREAIPLLEAELQRSDGASAEVVDLALQRLRARWVD